MFQAKCASCHAINKEIIGPPLAGFIEKYPWTERQNVYEWIKNPAAFMQKNSYAMDLKEVYGGRMMQAFPDISNEEIDAICEYLSFKQN